MPTFFKDMFDRSRLAPVCKEEGKLLYFAWSVLGKKPINTVIVNNVIKTDKSIMRVQYTLLVIACIYRDLNLVKALIKGGASVNLKNRYVDEDELVPPLYYATAVQDAEIVEYLLKSGANVNEYKGRKQFQDLIIPEEEKYSIFEMGQTDNFQPIYGPYDRPKASFRTLVQLYLNAGMKLNTAPWVPCLFYGRGGELSFQYGFQIVNIRFLCDTAVLLLQHGVDPNLYNLRDVLLQFSTHKNYTISKCIELKHMLKTFFAAGYNFSTVDRKDDLRERLKWYGVQNDEPATLKQICRTAIRRQLRRATEDKTIFPAIDKLEIPEILQEFLKLQDVINPLKQSSINCRPK